MKKCMWAVLATLVSTTIGCAYQGRDFSLDTVQSLSAGQSTMSQVRATMGDPKSIENKDGRTIWHYAYGQYTTAVAGPAGSTNSSKVATFAFSGETLADASWAYFSQTCTKTPNGGLEWGRIVDWSKMQSLPLNTTPAQVEQQFGPPTERGFDRNARTTSMAYTWSRVGGGCNGGFLVFKDEKLVSAKVTTP